MHSSSMPSSEPTPVESSRYGKDYFLENCNGFAEFLGDGELPLRLARALHLAKVQPDERVVDLGCGRGEVVTVCQVLGAMATGLDYAAAALEIARDSSAELPLVRAAMDAQPLKDATYDVAFSLDVVEHLTPRELDRFLSETYRILRPGGRLIVHTAPNRWYIDHGYRWVTRPVNLVLNRLFKFGLQPTSAQYPRTREDLEFHVNEQTPPGLARAIRKAGFGCHCWADNFSEWVVGGKTRLRSMINRLSPLSHFRPLSWVLANDLWAVARKK